ncbi:hypothetical protein [Neobacillus vireti]|uniref:Lipoprotein n=1 Tax=Neobacillus vireti LMG 21834 TaxID=1131730 RepID=A0AB94INF6_9BACI|nr:hypothetical protein [Neobacillus vireti]ETI68503.1 hypothetical protein BAVI_12259 [Neobacillus vireti LMG 21834]KLT15363.1 hypothetical protein AA980_24700 [Neobacillus vireti]
MIKDKKFFFVAIILFFISMILNFPFPDENPLGETVATLLNIPVKSSNGLLYVGITSFLLLILSLFFLSKSLKKYHGRFILLSIVVAIFLPPFIVDLFQKTLATGIYAISYQKEESNCRFEMMGETTLHGVCELPLENYSKNKIQFTIEFYDKYDFKEDLPMVTLMNKNAPYEVRLRGNQSERVKIETDIDVSKMKNHIESGNASSVSIIIKSGERIRKL